MSNVLLRPIITEKTMKEAALGRFTFEVDKAAQKPQIAKAISGAFKVNPVRVQTITVKGKTKRRGKRRAEIKLSSWKKAVVTLPAGQKIDLFDVTESESSRSS